MRTLEAFRATRTWCHDLGALCLSDDLRGRPGWVYLEVLYIEVSDEGPPMYEVMLDRTRSRGDLVSLEEQLYRWAMLNGFDDDEDDDEGDRHPCLHGLFWACGICEYDDQE